MKRFSGLIVFGLVMLFLFVLPGVSRAVVMVQSEKSISLESGARAITVSTNGRIIAVLLDTGKVNIYTGSGELKGTIKVAFSSTDIAISPDGSILYVTDAKHKVLTVLKLDYIIKLDVSDSPFVKGFAGAPVTITVFSDFQCPYCAKLGPLLQQVLKKYPKQVKLVYKFLPLPSIHKFAMQAAIAAQAAGKQGKFWEYHDGLLAAYQELSEKKLVEIGKKVGLNINQFMANRKDPRLINRVRKDMKEAHDNQVNSVPSVFINGRKLKRRTLGSFDHAITSELYRLGIQK
ncbi:MAG: thioredoxin domain-containing protein [Deltaproteobacteria bacterium]|nr:thioredoxin domain-containing protein [Deltaproteobacteria bacterium]